MESCISERQARDSERCLLQLQELVNKLENVTDKLTGSFPPDSYEDFGKAIAFLLRGFPEQDLYFLKTKLLSIVIKERSKKVLEKINPPKPTTSLQQSTKESTDKSNIARGLKRKVPSEESLPIDSTSVRTDSNNISVLPLDDSTKALPTDTITDCDVNVGLNGSSCGGLNNNPILEGSNKNTFPTDNALPSTSDKNLAIATDKQKTLNVASSSITKSCDEFSGKCEQSHFLRLKFPSRTYKTIKKKKIIESISNATTERETETLKSSANNAETLESINLPPTPNDKSSFTLELPTSVNLGYVAPKTNAQTLSVGTCMTRGPEHSLSDIESKNNELAQSSLPKIHAMQHTKKLQAKNKEFAQSSLSENQHLQLIEEVDIKCEVEDVESNNQSDSTCDQLEIKFEEVNISEPDLFDNVSFTHEVIKEENKFEAVFCEDTDPQLKEETGNQTEYKEDCLETLSPIDDVEIDLPVFICRYCSEIFFDEDLWTAHNMTKHQESEMTHKRKRRNQWSSSQMAKAISAVRGKLMGYNKASKIFQVPRTSLASRVKLKEPDVELAASKIGTGRKNIFSKTMEEKLVNVLIKLKTRTKTLTRKIICNAAFKFADKNNIAHRFGKNTAGVDWYRGFMRRNRDKLFTSKPKMKTVSIEDKE